MRPLAVPLAAALALVVAGCGGTRTVTVTRTVTTTRTVSTTPAGGPVAACVGADLGGSFDEVAGSAGAGQIVYRLTLTNGSSAPCSVGGLPRAQLLDARGAPLPTHVVASHRGGAATVVLRPGASAVAEARFSPDVAGSGDSETGACQPQAATLRVTANGGGTVDVPVAPPTSVCQQGQLQFDPLAGG